MDESIFDIFTLALAKQQQDKAIDEAIEPRLPTNAIADLNELPDGDPILGFFGTTSLNTPVAAAGLVLHYASSANYAVQLACLVGANGLYTRGKSGGTWSVWSKITTA